MKKKKKSFVVDPEAGTLNPAVNERVDSRREQQGGLMVQKLRINLSTARLRRSEKKKRSV